MKACLLKSLSLVQDANGQAHSSFVERLHNFFGEKLNSPERKKKKKDQKILISQVSLKTRSAYNLITLQRSLTYVYSFLSVLLCLAFKGQQTTKDH